MRNILISGIFLALITPLIVSVNMFFPYITGKNFFFRFLVEFLLIGWLILAYLNASYRPQKTPLVIASVVFIVIIALAGLFGENPHKSFWSNYERMEGVVGLLHIVGFFIIATSVFRTENIWKRFFQASLGVSVVVGIYGILQILGLTDAGQGITRIDSTLGNPAYLAVYALIHIFIALFLMVRDKVATKLLFYVYALVGILNLIVLYSTATRGAILGLIWGVLVTALLGALFEKDNKKLKKIAIGLIGGVVVFGGIFIGFKDAKIIQENTVLSRFADISFEEKTTRSRFMIWDMALEGFKERPVLGWGQENFNYVFNKYYNPRMYDQEPWFDRAHNVFLDWLIAGGILGLLSYLALFVIALVLIWRYRKFSVFEKSILTGLFVAYFIHNLFVFDHLVSYILFFSLLGFVAVTTRENKQRVFNEKKAICSFDTALIAFIITLVVCGSYFINYKPFVANLTLLNSIRPQEGGLETNYKFFQETLALNTFGNTEAREQLLQFSTSILKAEEVDQKTKDKFFEFAIFEQKKQIALAPNNIRHKILLASKLNSGGHTNEALLLFEQARKLSPKMQVIGLQKGIIYIIKGDLNKALEVLEKTHKILPEHREVKTIYALAALRKGDFKLADEIMGGKPLADTRIVNFYVSQGHYHKALETWEAIVKEKPNNPDYWLSLGATYLKLERYDEAIESIQKATKLNPDIQKEAGRHIDKIRAEQSL